MAYYYTNNRNSYITFSGSSTNSSSTWTGSAYYTYGTTGYNYTPPNKKKNHELVHLLKKKDYELAQIDKLKQGLRR